MCWNSTKTVWLTFITPWPLVFYLLLLSLSAFMDKWLNDTSSANSSLVSYFIFTNINLSVTVAFCFSEHNLTELSDYMTSQCWKILGRKIDCKETMKVPFYSMNMVNPMLVQFPILLLTLASMSSLTSALNVIWVLP